jgi:hypothetical protein
MLKITWKGKLQKVDFAAEYERYQEQWTECVTLEDLVVRLSKITKVPIDRIKLLHSGGMFLSFSLIFN